MFNAPKLSAFFAALVACAICASSAQAAWTVASGTAATTNSQLLGASCTSTSNCVLVGTQSGTTTTELASRWNGSAFATLVGASTRSELYGVSCNSTTFCMAVGADFTGATITHSETYNGTTWTNKTTTTPAGSVFAQLGRVSCVASTTCYAAGYYQTSNTTRLPLVQKWTNAGWTVQTLTLPSGATSSALNGISCSATTTCTAVGYYDSNSNPRRPLILRLSGTTWSTQTGVTQSGATVSELQGVWCTTSTSCNAVGNYEDASTTGHGLAELWNGTTWTLKTVTDATGGIDTALADIACSGASCTAVGGYSATTTIEPYAATWNGSTWTTQAVPKPTGATDGALSGVSCPTTCLAAGLSDDTNGLHPQLWRGP
jgi:hypothetical protein